MKRITYILLAVVLPFASCKKEMMGYEGMEGIYFAVRYGGLVSEASAPYRSSTNVEFVRQPAHVQEMQVYITVAITGPVKNYDRPFRVEINPDSTTAEEGVHYEPIGTSFVIPANAIQSVIPVTVKRTPDMLNENKKIGLRLLPNEHFELAFTKWKAVPDLASNNLGADTAFDASMHSINVNDMMVEPEVWYGSVTATQQETGLWGAFTRKKMELMCELFNLTYEDFSSETTMPLVLSTLISTELSRYLIEQFNNGTPVLEEDGRLMWCGSVPWTSIIGVPYI
jgi:hypothetical protein